jgi:hypothetical protein
LAELSATLLQARAVRDGEEWVIDGHKCRDQYSPGDEALKVQASPRARTSSAGLSTP